MKSLLKITMALFVAALISSTPLMAAEANLPGGIKVITPEAKTPDASTVLKNKAADAVEGAKQKVDAAADNLQKSLGVDKTAQQAKDQKEQVVDVTQETVTVQTPDGVAQETTTTITPEKAPAPAK